MDKELILSEILRTANENGGTPLGISRFANETGIKDSDWKGVFWARWGDAQVEAGFTPNVMQIGYKNDQLLDKLIILVRQLGRLPVLDELKLRRREDAEFPSYAAFRRFGSGRYGLADALIAYCNGRGEYTDIVALCQQLPPKQNYAAERVKPEKSVVDDGFVYLLRSGRNYKIGRSKSHGRREYELAIQLPERAEKVHVIATDDPVGIEAYWHNRFSEKRKNGEWFDLSAADVKAFKRRKFM